MLPGCERGAAGLAAKGLNPLGLAMFAISDEGMDVRLGDPEVRALLVGTSEALGGYALGALRRLFTSLQGRIGAEAGPTFGKAMRTSRGSHLYERASESGVRLVPKTMKPLAESLSAVACPIPDDAPVTRAT